MGVCRDVTNWIWVRYSHAGRSCDGLKSARPRATTAAQHRSILVNHLRDRFRTTPSTASHIPGRKTDLGQHPPQLAIFLFERQISSQTVINRLRQFSSKATCTKQYYHGTSSRWTTSDGSMHSSETCTVENSSLFRCSAQMTFQNLWTTYWTLYRQLCSGTLSKRWW